MNARLYEQFRKQNLAAVSDLEAVVLLYKEAIDALGKAEVHLADKSSEYKKDIARAQKIIQGLRGIINFNEGGEIAHNLAELYSYFNSRLTVAGYGVRKAPEIILEVSGLLKKLRESWLNILPKNNGSDATSYKPNIERLDLNI